MKETNLCLTSAPGCAYLQVRNRLRSMDLRHNKLGDEAGQDICQGLARRKHNRCIIRIMLEDNLMDPLIVQVLAALCST